MYFRYTPMFTGILKIITVTMLLLQMCGCSVASIGSFDRDLAAKKMSLSGELEPNRILFGLVHIGTIRLSDNTVANVVWATQVVTTNCPREASYIFLLSETYEVRAKWTAGGAMPLGCYENKIYFYADAEVDYGRIVGQVFDVFLSDGAFDIEVSQQEVSDLYNSLAIEQGVH